MAEEVLITIAESLVTHLASAAVNEIALASGFKPRLERLRDTANNIKDVLLDAEERQLHSHAVRGWVQRLKAAAYEADDLFDEFSTIASQKKNIRGNKFTREVTSFFSSTSNPFKVSFSISSRIKNIMEKLDEIDQDGKRFAFSIRPYDDPSNGKKAILGILDGYQNQRLAHLVDEEIEKDFELSMWVCVSNEFDLKEIVRNIIKSATKIEPQNLELDQLQEELNSQINGKKYILVLDDVWNDNVEKWLKLSAMLTVGMEGSKIIVTTRLMEVAGIMGTYVLKGLSNEESLRMAFLSGEKENNLNIAKEIVKKCAYVPLAIRNLGSLLRGKDKQALLHMKDRSLVDIPENGSDRLTISYHLFNSSLKNCFAYCALFPKDFELEKKTLINLWMAQGFVIPIHQSQSLEEAGEEYFLILLQIGCFQNITKDKWGNIASCKMHDLFHDLALQVSGIECKLAKYGEVVFDERTHHLSFEYGGSSLLHISRSVLNLKLLRTFLLPIVMKYSWFSANSRCDELLSSCRCLRVLDLHNLEVDSLPRSIGKLIHLRYLNLSGTNIKELPASITKLQNLQTLDLNSCSKLESLPAGTGKLTNLRTLDVDKCLDLRQMPSGLGALTHLHTLPLLLVGKKAEYGTSNSPAAQLWELRKLVRLKGSLKIEIHGLPKDVAYESKEANLASTDGLITLNVEVKYNIIDKRRKYCDALLEGLKPHSNLKKLKICGYGKLPSWTLKDNLCFNLPNLVEVELMYLNCQQVPSFSQLPFLKCLVLSKLSVEYLSSGPCELAQDHKLFFPSLQELTLCDMSNLRGWWKGVRKVNNLQPSFPNLTKLVVSTCRCLQFIPHCPEVQDLTLWSVNPTLAVLRLAANCAAGGSSMSNSSESFSKVKIACVDNVGDLIYLPKESFSHLISLKIQQLYMSGNYMSSTCILEEVFKRGPNSLTCLELSYLSCLTSISRGFKHLTSLEKLIISHCTELDLLESEDVDNGMPWKALTNLRYLTFDEIPKLFALPNGLRHLKNLRTLEVKRYLESVPEWISCLSSLEKLILERCCRLDFRCRDPSGEDWPKIKHIPVVKIV